MKMKKLKTGTAMALTLAVMGAPMIKASASEIDNKILDMDQREYIRFLKEEFNKEYGKENKFKTIYEDEYVKEEVNGKTTEIKTTNKENEEIDSYNYFDLLDERVKVSEMNEEESIEYLKAQIDETKEIFHKQYGTENKFKTIYEDEYVKEEVNGATGEYRTTNKDSELVDIYNYFDELNSELDKI